MKEVFSQASFDIPLPAEPDEILGGVDYSDNPEALADINELNGYDREGSDESADPFFDDKRIPNRLDPESEEALAVLEAHRLALEIRAEGIQQQLAHTTATSQLISNTAALD